MTTLEALSKLSVIVADTGDLDAIARLKPVDCTTNPTLVLRVSRLPQYRTYVDQALSWAATKASEPSLLARLAARRLAVLMARQATRLVPGRVSIEVDARLSFDTSATFEEAMAVIESCEELGVQPDRVLIKIAATWEGMQAARRLQRAGIDCNITLVFCEAQGLAAADAGAFLISPFVGRVTDWHKRQLPPGAVLDHDPGVDFVQQLHARFKAEGRQTVVMAASFRTTEQVLALAGCDRLTIAPALIEALAHKTDAVQNKLGSKLIGAQIPDPINETAFRTALNADAMATEKLAEGIRGFIADIETLERELLAQYRPSAAAGKAA